MTNSERCHAPGLVGNVCNKARRDIPGFCYLGTPGQKPAEVGAPKHDGSTVTLNDAIADHESFLLTLDLYSGCCKLDDLKLRTKQNLELLRKQVK